MCQGMTALDWVRDQLDSDDEDSEDDQPIAANRRAVCDYLERKMEQMTSVDERPRQRLSRLLGYGDSDKTPSPTASQEYVMRAGRAVRRWKNRNFDLESESNSMEVDETADGETEVSDVHDSVQMQENQDNLVIHCGYRLKNLEPEVGRRKLSLVSSNKKTSYLDFSTSEMRPVGESGMPRALIAESDDSDQESSTIDNWLIDDIGPTAKRRCTSRTTTPRSPHPRHNRQRQDAPLVRNSRSPIERLADVTTRTARNDSNVMLHAPSATVVSPPMRVHVSVLGKRFVIPCPNIEGSGQKIEWVAGEAASRYYSMTGLRPRLTLKTTEGALFDSNDCVANVLVNNEELQGDVESWDLPPLTDRYLKACSSAGQG